MDLTKRFSLQKLKLNLRISFHDADFVEANETSVNKLRLYYQLEALDKVWN